MGPTGGDAGRRARWQAWQRRRRAEARLPLPEHELRELFADVEARLDEVGCDGSLKLVQAWAETHGVAFAALAPWCRRHGGFCDCEVIANVAPALG